MPRERRNSSPQDVKPETPRAVQRALSMMVLYFLIIAIPLGGYLVYTSNQDSYFTAWRFRQLNAISTEMIDRTKLIGQILSYHDFSTAGDKHKANWPGWLRSLNISAQQPVSVVEPYHNFLENFEAKYNHLTRHLYHPPYGKGEIRFLEKEREALHRELDEFVNTLNFHIDCLNFRTRTTAPVIELELDAENPPKLKIAWAGCAPPEDIDRIIQTLDKLSDINAQRTTASLNELHKLEIRPIKDFLNEACTTYKAANLDTCPPDPTSTGKQSEGLGNVPDKIASIKEVIPLAKLKFNADPALFEGWHISTDLKALVPEQSTDTRRFDDILIVAGDARILSRRTSILGDHIPGWINSSEPSTAPTTVSKEIDNIGALKLAPNIELMEDQRFENKRLLKTNGRHYYLLCQPLQLPAKGARNLSLCGLIEKTRFDEGVGEISPRQVSIFLLVLLLSFALLPFLKIALISREEAFRKRDFAAVRLAMIAGGSVLTILVLEIIAYRYFVLEIDSVARQIAHDIKQSTKVEVDNLEKTARFYAKHFDSLNKEPFPDLTKIKKQNGSNCKPSESGAWASSLGVFNESNVYTHHDNSKPLVRPPVHYYSNGLGDTTHNKNPIGPPHYEVMIATNNQGQQLGPVITSRKGMWLGVPANVKDRTYFKQAMSIIPGALSVADLSGDGCPDKVVPDETTLTYAIQRIRERSIGEKLTALAIPLNETNQSGKIKLEGTLEPGIIFATRHLYALYKPLLPPGFGFAVLDNRTNQLRYHSEDDLSLVENMLEEVDPGYALEFLGRQNGGSQNVRYHGRDHRIFVTNIEELNGRLIIFYDPQYPQAMAYQSVILSLCLLAIYILILLVSGMIVQKLVGRVRGEVQLAVWQWPHYSLNKHYHWAALGQLFIGGIVLFICMSSPNSYLLPVILMLVPLLVIGGQAWFLGFFSRQSFTVDQLVNISGRPPPALKKGRLLACTAVYLINLGLLPSFIIFSSAQSVTTDNLMYAWHRDMEDQEIDRKEIIRKDLLRINKDTYSDIDQRLDIPGNYWLSLCEADKASAGKASAYLFCSPNYSRSWAHLYAPLIPVWNSATRFLDLHYSFAEDQIDDQVINTAKPLMFLPNILTNPNLIRKNLFQDKPGAIEDNPYRWLICISVVFCLLITGSILLIFLPWVARKLLGTHLQGPLPLQIITPEQISLNQSTTLIRPKPGFAKEVMRANEQACHCVHVNIGLDAQHFYGGQLSWLTEAQLDSADFFILEAFDSRLTDSVWLNAKLELLEAIHRRGKHALILTDVALPYRITIYEGEDSQALLTRTEAQRWGNVLGHYTKLRHLPNVGIQTDVYLPMPLVRECFWDAALGDIVLKSWQSNTHLVEHLKGISWHFTGYDELSSRWVADIGRARFRKIWTLSTQREKLVLYRIASGALLNPANSDIVEHLIQRRLLIRWPDFQIASTSFRQFILEAESPQTFEEWETQSKTGLWASVQRPIAVLFVAILALLISTQSGASQALVAIITAFAGGLPLLSLIFGRVQAPGMSSQ